MNLLCTYCTSSKADLLQYTSTLLQSILSRFNESDSDVLDISWNALSAVMKVNIPVKPFLGFITMVTLATDWQILNKLHPR